MSTNWELKNWSNLKVYDLSIPISHLTPAWPTYEPLQIKFFKRLSPNGANGQLLTHSNHVGTHLDVAPALLHPRRGHRQPGPEGLPGGSRRVVDLSDIAEDYGIYGSKDIEDRAEVHDGGHPDHQHGLPQVRLGPA